MFRINNGIVTDTLLFGLPSEYFTTSDITDNYDITLYNKYHQLQISDLLDENIMIMEAKVNLTEDDINALDFRRPIFIESIYGNSYFKLLECEYSGSETLATVKLQPIIK